MFTIVSIIEYCRVAGDARVDLPKLHFQVQIVYVSS